MWLQKNVCQLHPPTSSQLEPQMHTCNANHGSLCWKYTHAGFTYESYPCDQFSYHWYVWYMRMGCTYWFNTTLIGNKPSLTVYSWHMQCKPQQTLLEACMFALAPYMTQTHGSSTHSKGSTQSPLRTYNSTRNNSLVEAHMLSIPSFGQHSFQRTEGCRHRWFRFNTGCLITLLESYALDLHPCLSHNGLAWITLRTQLYHESMTLS